MSSWTQMITQETVIISMEFVAVNYALLDPTNVFLYLNQWKSVIPYTWICSWGWNWDTIMVIINPRRWLIAPITKARYQFPSAATSTICSGFWPWGPVGATCPVGGWDCYCGWEYALKNGAHGYETTGKGPGTAHTDGRCSKRIRLVLLSITSANRSIDFFFFSGTFAASTATIPRDCLDVMGDQLMLWTTWAMTNLHPCPVLTPQWCRPIRHSDFLRSRHPFMQVLWQLIHGGGKLGVQIDLIYGLLPGLQIARILFSTNQEQLGVLVVEPATSESYLSLHLQKVASSQPKAATGGGACMGAMYTFSFWARLLRGWSIQFCWRWKPTLTDT